MMIDGLAEKLGYPTLLVGEQGWDLESYLAQRDRTQGAG
jgi:hypothetical protein